MSFYYQNFKLQEKMANLELNKLIHKKHVTNNNKITKT